MPGQEKQATPLGPRHRPWWAWVCRWLWRAILGLSLASILTSLAVNVLSTWLTSSKGTIPNDSPWEVFLTMLHTHWLTALLITCCLVLSGALVWAISHWGTEETTIPTLPLAPNTQNRSYMLGRLRLRYEQMLAQSLQGAVQLELGLVSRPVAIQSIASLSLRLPNQPEHPLPSGTSIIQAYKLAQQELLILGEPGAGKSTLLLELAHHLVEQAEQDATQPLPVLLPLSSWASDHHTLQSWLAEQFTLLYDVPSSLSQQWIHAEQLLFLLDGLDEMEISERTACITAINTYHREHLQSLVVCSRTNEYDASSTHERLALHTSVIIQSLSPEQVNTYLKNLGRPLTSLRAALKKNTTLAELATTPLILQVLILTYHGISVQKLSYNEDHLRQQIWNNYIQRMISRKGDIKRYPLHTTNFWLGWLAREMRQHNQTIFLLEQLQPDWLPERTRALYRWSIGLFGGLLAGLFYGITFGLLCRLILGPIGGLICGLSIGLIGAAIFGRSSRRGRLSRGLRNPSFNPKLDRPENEIEPIEILIWSPKRGILHALSGMLLGGLSGLSITLAVGLNSGIRVGLLYGLSSGLLGGILYGFSGAPLSERHLFSPNEGIRRSAKNGLLLSLLVGLFIGGISGVLFGIAVGVISGSLLGVITGMIFGLDAVVQHYILRFWLRSTHLFLWEAVPFLEDATIRVLLRHVGGGYSFTHRLLLEYFADRNADTLPVPTTQSNIKQGSDDR